MDNAAENAPIENEAVAQDAAPVEQQATNQVEQTPQATEAERPEWLPGKFKSAEDMAKSYTELEKKLGAPKEAPDEYLVNVSPETLTAIGLENAEGLSADPMVSGFMELAKSEGVSQEFVDKAIAMYLDGDVQLLQGEAERKQQEMAALGPKANERIREAGDWMRANLSENAYNTLAARLEDAPMVEALEELRQLSGTPNLPMGDALPTESRQEMEQKLQSMQFEKDENGNRKMSTDPAFRKRFRELQIKLHGTAPSIDVIS